MPAFVGLGAPHWDAEARGAIFGLTRNTGPAEFARAALESVAYQTRDLLDAMHKDWKSAERQTVLRVDGGMVASDWTMQRLADILDAPVDRPTVLETTALGAAWLAGSQAGVWPNADRVCDELGARPALRAGRWARPSARREADGLARRGAADADEILIDWATNAKEKPRAPFGTRGFLSLPGPSCRASCSRRAAPARGT